MFFKKLFTFSSVLTRIVSPYSCFLVNDSNRIILIRKLVFLFERAIKKHFNFSYLGDRCLFDTKWNWFRSWRIRRPFEPILSGSLEILSIATCFGFCDIFLQQSWQVDAKFEFFTVHIKNKFEDGTYSFSHLETSSKLSVVAFRENRVLEKL